MARYVRSKATIRVCLISTLVCMALWALAYIANFNRLWPYQWYFVLPIAAPVYLIIFHVSDDFCDPNVRGHSLGQIVVVIIAGAVIPTVGMLGTVGTDKIFG